MEGSKQSLQNGDQDGGSNGTTGKKKPINKRRKSRDEGASGSVEKVCTICGFSEDDELLFGKFYTRDKVKVHYFCMLFSSALSQLGEQDEDGIQGFLIPDIMKEVKRGKRLRCTYCRRAGATIGCSLKKCRVLFHLPCGRKHNSLHQFFGMFESYCPDHRRLQSDTMGSDRLAFHGTGLGNCSICLNPVETRASFQTVKTPCCKNGWFHTLCIQKLAINAGFYFFKCPLCNNSEMFKDEMLKCGIYIPEQDASWELEENAFADLYQRHGSCDQSKCFCPKGRNYNKTAGLWKILLCMYCGSRGTHFKCAKNLQHQNWRCDDCLETISKKNNEKKKAAAAASNKNRSGNKRLRSELSKVNEEVEEAGPSSRKRGAQIEELESIPSSPRPASASGGPITFREFLRTFNLLRSGSVEKRRRQNCDATGSDVDDVIDLDDDEVADFGDCINITPVKLERAPTDDEQEDVDIDGSDVEADKITPPPPVVAITSFDSGRRRLNYDSESEDEEIDVEGDDPAIKEEETSDVDVCGGSDGAESTSKRSRSSSEDTVNGSKKGNRKKKSNKEKGLHFGSKKKRRGPGPGPKSRRGGGGKRDQPPKPGQKRITDFFFLSGGGNNSDGAGGSNQNRRNNPIVMVYRLELEDPTRFTYNLNDMPLSWLMGSNPKKQGAEQQDTPLDLTTFDSQNRKSLMWSWGEAGPVKKKPTLLVHPFTAGTPKKDGEGERKDGSKPNNMLRELLDRDKQSIRREIDSKYSNKEKSIIPETNNNQHYRLLSPRKLKSNIPETYSPRRREKMIVPDALTPSPPRREKMIPLPSPARENMTTFPSPPRREKMIPLPSPARENMTSFPSPPREKMTTLPDAFPVVETPPSHHNPGSTDLFSNNKNDWSQPSSHHNPGSTDLFSNNNQPSSHHNQGSTDLFSNNNDYNQPSFSNYRRSEPESILPSSDDEGTEPSSAPRVSNLASSENTPWSDEQTQRLHNNNYGTRTSSSSATTVLDRLLREEYGYSNCYQNPPTDGSTVEDFFSANSSSENNFLSANPGTSSSSIPSTDRFSEIRVNNVPNYGTTSGEILAGFYSDNNNDNAPIIDISSETLLSRVTMVGQQLSVSSATQRQPYENEDDLIVISSDEEEDCQVHRNYGSDVDIFTL